MFINTDISHVDEYYGLPEEERKKFDKAVLEELKKRPPKHLETEWGRFQKLEKKTEEEVEDLIDDILQEMTLEQKIYQMSGDNLPKHVGVNPSRYNFIPYYAGEDCELDIPGIKFTDGPTGIVMGYHSTAFPVSIARGASFDVELEERIGEAMGIEGRSGGANLLAGVCVNLLRHPAWGRAQETYGEDSCLLGEMGAALTRGIQKHMMACIKHFAFNSLENVRFRVNVEADERTVREIYLPHFKRCVEAGAACVMSAYNRFRGTYCGHNGYLLNHILKEEWKFRGFVMSDFMWGIRDTVEAANGGQCMEMDVTQFFGEKLVKAVKSGEVSERVVEDAVRRILRQKIRFARVGTAEKYGVEKMGCKEHILLAREASEKSTVLLKNEGRLLPLNLSGISNLLVVGSKAVIPNIGDTKKGSSAVYPDYVVTPLEGLRNLCGNHIKIRYIDGNCRHMTQYYAQMADAVIIIAGLTCEEEGEYDETGGQSGGDRDSLELNKAEREMIEAAAEANSNTIVCLQGGSIVLTSSWEKYAKAILIQWYSGMEGGNALARVLFGIVNPSAKLPVTIPASIQQLPFYHRELEEIKYDFYHGYFLVDKRGETASYPFGYGLSYTTFSYKNLLVQTKGNDIMVSVDVTNTGDRAGEEVVQVYVSYLGSAVERHRKDLRGFSKIFLKPGHTGCANILFSKECLQYYSEKEGRWILENITYTIMAGPSSKEEDLLKVNFRFDE